VPIVTNLNRWLLLGAIGIALVSELTFGSEIGAGNPLTSPTAQLPTTQTPDDRLNRSLGILRQVTIETLPADRKAIFGQPELDRLFADRYNRNLDLASVKAIVEQINQLYKQRGYDLAQVVNVENLAGDGRLKLVVTEGAIEDVRVRFFTRDNSGRDRYVDDRNQPIGGTTRPFIITREAETKTGSIFNRRTIEGDLRRIYGLGLFKDLKLSFQPGSIDPSKVILTFDVLETGKNSSVNGGGTVGSSSGLGAFGSYKQLNLGGNNQTLGGTINIGGTGTTYDLRFTEPWIATDTNRTGYEVSLVQNRSLSSIFYGGKQSVSLPNSTDSPTVLRSGGSISFSRPLSGNPFDDRGWRASAGVQYQKVSIQTPSGQISPTDAAGKPLSFSGTGQDDLLTLQLSLSQDSRDNFLDPSSGDVMRLGVDRSIPIGNAQISMTKLRGSYTKYLPVKLTNFDKGTQAFVVNIQSGTILGDLPPYEAFSLGGVGSVRGYEDGDVGTGRSFLQATAEYRFPIVSFLGGALFADYGTDLGSGKLVPGDPAGTRLKPGNGFGYGVGVRIQNQFIPLRLDFGRNNLGEERIQFGFGDRF
jgi:outer membrane protein insertion porin family